MARPAIRITLIDRLGKRGCHRGHRVGESFDFDTERGKLCPMAMHVAFPYVDILRYGGAIPGQPTGTAVFCCPDVDTINVFRIEVSDRAGRPGLAEKELHVPDGQAGVKGQIDPVSDDLRQIVHLGVDVLGGDDQAVPRALEGGGVRSPLPASASTSQVRVAASTTVGTPDRDDGDAQGLGVEGGPACPRRSRG